MTPEIFSRIKGIISVYGTGKVNINTAGFYTLYALGLNERLCQRIIEFRRGQDERYGTEDDFIFRSPQELRDIGFLFTEDSIQLNSLISRDILSVKSDVFRISSCAKIKDKLSAPSRRIVCVVKRILEKEPEILYWHED